MREQNDVEVELNGRFIIVTAPGTSYRASYFQHPDVPGLMQSDFMTDDANAAISRNQFLALAWKAANIKAVELGWIA
jgi:hypothetical protein